LERHRLESRAWRRRLTHAVAAPLLVGALLFPGVALADRSLNWSGVAYQSSTTSPVSGYVSDIKAQWVVPALTCVAGAPNATSSIWVGIDGFTTGTTVEQIGTQQVCTNGVASYSPFFEMYPSPPSSFNLAIKPGDQVSAEVKCIGSGKFTLSLANLTTGKSYATTQTSKTALRQSAELIVEAQTVNGIITPVANFGTVQFTNPSLTVSGSGGSVTIIALVNTSGSVLADSSGLQVVWKQAS
jgi:hypothetical protein